MRLKVDNDLNVCAVDHVSEKLRASIAALERVVGIRL
jgi:hypothetical protein